MDFVEPKAMIKKWKIETPQSKTIKWSKDVNEHLQNKQSGYVVFGKEMSGFKNRIYGLAPFEVFFERYSQLNPTHRRYHEQFTDNEPVRFFLDIEAPKWENKLGSDTDFIKDIIEDVVISTCIRTFENMFQYIGIKATIDKKDLTILTAFADDKYSVHVIAEFIYFWNVRHLNNFTQDLYYNCNVAIERLYKAELSLIKTLDIKKGGHVKPLFDFNVFQSLRMYASTNTTETRPFKYWNPKTKSIISEFDQDILKKTMITYTPPNIENLIIQYDQIHAPVIDRCPTYIHDHQKDNFSGIKGHASVEKIKCGIDIAKRIYSKEGVPFDGIIKKIKENKDKSRILFSLGKNICPIKFKNEHKPHSKPNGLALIVDMVNRTAMIFCKKEGDTNQKKKRVNSNQLTIKTITFNLTQMEYETLSN